MDLLNIDIDKLANISFDALEALKGAKIDASKEYTKPENAVEIFNGRLKPQRFLTMGNFSVITGKSKSKKTFLATMIVASANNPNAIYAKFQGRIHGKQILYFDTEQAQYDVYQAYRKLVHFSEPKNLHVYGLREYDSRDRIEIIDAALDEIQNVGLVLIDGVADLVEDINDIREGSAIAQRLLKWTKEKNIHIVTVIHQNKNDNYATGHLGSFLLKKAEMVIGAEKNNDDVKYSTVTCQAARGTREFEPFEFWINENGLPILGHETKGTQNEQIEEWLNS